MLVICIVIRQDLAKHMKYVYNNSMSSQTNKTSWCPEAHTLTLHLLLRPTDTLPDNEKKNHPEWNKNRITTGAEREGVGDMTTPWTAGEDDSSHLTQKKIQCIRFNIRIQYLITHTLSLFQSPKHKGITYDHVRLYTEADNDTWPHECQLTMGWLVSRWVGLERIFVSLVQYGILTVSSLHRPIGDLYTRRGVVITQGLDGQPLQPDHCHLIPLTCSPAMLI